MEQQKAIKSFIEKAAPDYGVEYSDEFANDIIKSYSGNYNKIVADIGRKKGIPENNIDAFTKDAMNQFGIVSPSDQNKAELNFINTNREFQDENGYQRYSMLEEDLGMAQSLISQIEDESDTPRYPVTLPGDVAPQESTRVNQKLPPVEFSDIDTSEDIDNLNRMNRLADLKAKQAEIEQRMADQAELNRKEFGYVSEQHQLAMEEFEHYDLMFKDAMQTMKDNASFSTVGMPHVNYRPEDAERMKDLKDLKNIYKNIGKILAAPQGADAKAQLHGLMYGLTQSSTAIDFFTLGLNEMSKDLNVKAAFDNYNQFLNEASGVEYDLRNDGTQKGIGWLGRLDTPDGGVATEYTIGVTLDGKDIDIPSLVPTLTEDEIALMQNDIIPNGKVVPDSIVNKAAKHAIERMRQGKSPFVTNEEYALRMLPETERQLLEAHSLFLNARNSTRQNFMTTMGTGLQDMLPFIAQFAATGGTATTAKAAVKKFIESRTKKALLAKTGGTLAGIATQGTLMVPATLQNYAERVAPTTGEDGNLVAGEEQWDAIYKSYLTTLAEVAGETVTSLAQAGTRNAAIKILARNPGQAKKFAAKIALRLANETGVPSVQSVAFEGIGEEATGLMQAAIDQDGAFFTSDAQIQLWTLSLLAGGSGALLSVPTRVAVKQRYNKSVEDLMEIPNQDYTEAVKGATENYTDPNELVKTFMQLNKAYQVKMGSPDFMRASNFVANSIRYNQMSNSRNIQTEQGIAQFHDNEGNVTTAQINGETWYVRNPKDIGVPGKAIFAKNADGEVKAFSSWKVESPQTFTPQQVKNAAANEQDLMDEAYANSIAIQEQAAAKGLEEGRTIITPTGKGTLVSINDDGTLTIQNNKGEQENVRIDEAEPFKTQEQKETEREAQVNQENEEAAIREGIDEKAEITADEAQELPDGTSLRVVDFSNGQSKIITAAGEIIVNSVEERDQALSDMLSSQESSDTAEGDEPDIDSMAPDEAYEYLIEKHPEAANQILGDHIANLKSQSKEAKANSKKAQKNSEKLKFIEEGKAIDAEISRLEEIQSLPDRQLAVDKAESIYQEFMDDQASSEYNQLEEWEQNLLGYTIDQESFNRFGDKNKTTSGIAKAWFAPKSESKNSTSQIDSIAQELSETAGREITPDDIVEFILAHPDKNVRKTTANTNTIKAAYKDATGQTIDKHKEFIEQSGLTPREIKKSTDDPRAQAYEDSIQKLKEAGYSDEQIQKAINAMDGVQEQEQAEVEDDPIGQAPDEDMPFKIGEVQQEQSKESSPVLNESESKEDNLDDIYRGVSETIKNDSNMESDFLLITNKARHDLRKRMNSLNALKELSDELKQAIVLINSSEMPEEVKAHENKLGLKEGEKGVAYFYQGNVYVIADRITSVSEGKKSFIHEMVVHKKFSELFENGNQTILGQTYSKFTDLLNDVYDSMTDKQRHQIGRIYTPGLFGKDGKAKREATAKEKEQIAEEYLAHLSETEKVPTKFQGFIDKLLQILRKAFKFTSSHFSQNDLFRMLQEQRQRTAQSPTTKSGINPVLSEEGKEEVIIPSPINFRTNEGDAFDAWKGKNKLVESHQISDVKTGEPIVAKVYHGTTHEFYEFKGGEKGNIEGHMGATNYFTSDYGDADNNYRADGADLTGRIESRIDQIQWEIGNALKDGTNYENVASEWEVPIEDIDGKDEREIAQYIAEKELKGEDDKVMELYVKLNNPLVLGRDAVWVDTIAESELEDYMEDASEEIAEENGIEVDEAKEDYSFEIRSRAIENSGAENKIVEAFHLSLEGNDNYSNLWQYLPEDVNYERQVDLNYLDKKLRESLNNAYIENDEGQLITAQIMSDFYEELGYDGVILTDVAERFPNMGLYDGISHIHVPDQYNNQIKLADGSNVTFGNTSDIRFRTGQSPIGFYSTVERALDNIEQRKGTVGQFQRMLIKNGAKQPELDWMGFNDHFDNINKSITKKELQEWIDANKIDIQETVLKGNQEAIDRAKKLTEEKYGIEAAIENNPMTGVPELFILKGRPKNMSNDEYNDYYDEVFDFFMGEADINPETSPKHKELVTDGGEDYFELVLTMPNQIESYSPDKLHFTEAGGGTAVAWARANTRMHGDEKVLFLEEVQSKRSQDGKMTGFKDKNTGGLPWAFIIDTGAAFVLKYRDGDTGKYHTWGQSKTLEDAKRWYNMELDKGEPEVLTTEQFVDAGQRVPDTPFRKTPQWLNLITRRMIRYAAENGFDRIAWTNGQQQNERYNLSNVIDQIEYEKQEEGLYSISGRKDGKTVLYKGRISESELASLLGKEVAQKIVNNEGEEVPGGHPRWLLSGMNIEAGGSGMRTFYNNIMPSTASKLGKRFGAKVEEISMKFGEDYNPNPLELTAEAWDGELTPKIKETALGWDYWEKGDWLIKKNGSVIYSVAKEEAPTMEDAIEYWYQGQEEADGYIRPLGGTHKIMSLPVNEKMKESAIEDGMPMFRIGERTIPVTDFPESMRDVVINTNLSTLKKQPGYRRAKYDLGIDDAFEIVRKLVKPKKLEAIRQFINPDNKTMVVPVIQKEQDNVNTLPIAYAEAIENYLGVPVNNDIQLTENGANTGKNLKDRMDTQLSFEGEVVPGADYIIADDVYTSGNTIYSLAEYIKSNGGNPIVVTTLAPSRYGTKFIPDESSEKLKEFINFADDEKKQFKYLTAAEIQALSLPGRRTKAAISANNKPDKGVAFRTEGQITPEEAQKLLGKVSLYFFNKPWIALTDNEMRQAYQFLYSPDGTDWVNENGYGQDTRAEIDQAASQAASSPDNNLPEPSDKQKKAGNYKMGHVSFDGFDISIENPAGSIRSGKSPSGEEWKNIMPVDYGYVRGTVGKDKDHIDVFIGKNPELDKVYVVDQVDPASGEFDEHKVMMGFSSISAAKKAYNEAYDVDWKGMGNITRTTKEELKEWFKSGKTKEPFAAVKFRTSESDAPIFYSPTEKALASIKQEKGKPEQFKAMLLKNGAKQAELDWMGWDDFARDIDVTTKTDIQNWIDANRIDVREVAYGNRALSVSDWKPVDDTKEKYTHPGSDFTVNHWGYDDEKEADMYQILDKDGYDPLGDAMPLEEALRTASNMDAAEDEDYGLMSVQPKYYNLQLSGGDNYRELLLTMPKQKGQDFKTSHFDEPNILAHIRFNERTMPNGEKVLFLEEIQSDWAQQGKKSGFKKDDSELELEPIITKDEIEIIETEHQYAANVRGTYRYVGKGVVSSPDAAKEYFVNWLNKDVEIRNEQIKSQNRYYATPDMPFKSTPQWTSLALRRMIRWAAENGFDRIAWTTGEQQAERYNLSKQVRSLKITQDPESELYLIEYLPSDNSSHVFMELADDVPGDKLDSYVGKEIAKKALDGYEEFEGDDLKVGGEGMKAFYDKILPSTAGKIGKKFGAKVEPISFQQKGEMTLGQAMKFMESEGFIVEDQDDMGVWVGDEDSNDAWQNRDSLTPEQRMAMEVIAGSNPDASRDLPVSEQLSLPITDKMKKSAMEDGMPMFRTGSTELEQWFKDKKLLAVPYDTFTPMTRTELFREVKSTLKKWEKDYGLKRYDYKVAKSWFNKFLDLIPKGNKYNVGSDDLFVLSFDIYKNLPNNMEKPDPSSSSSEFKVWFEDSKVVDEKGKPLVVFHGTPNEFKTFQVSDGGTFGPGIYFTKNRDDAAIYAGNEEGGEANGHIMPVYVRINNPASEKIASEAEAEHQSLAMDYLKGKGYDGIIAGDEVIAFEPNQIKSATKNEGTYYPHVDNIHFRVSEKDFYKKFKAIHKDIRTKGDSKTSILNDGFEEGKNVNALPFYKGYDRSTDIVHKAYGAKEGDFVWLLPKEGVTDGTNGYKTKKGYKPSPEDGFFIVDGSKSVYENYLLNQEGSPDIKFRIKSDNPEVQKMLDKLDELQKLSKSTQKIKELQQKAAQTIPAQRQKILDEIASIKQGVSLGTSDTKQRIKAIQSTIADYAKANMPMGDAGKRDLSSILTILKNAQTPGAIEKAFEKIDELTGKVNEASERKRGIKTVNRLLKWMTGYRKQGNNRVGKFEYEMVKQFDALKSLNEEAIRLSGIRNGKNSTDAEKDQANAELESMWNEINDKEDKSLLDHAMLKLIELRRMGNKASIALVNSLNEELQYIYEKAKDAKSEEDYQRALNRREDREFVEQFIEDNAIEKQPWYRRAMNSLGNFTSNILGNWETIMTVVGGNQMRDKFSLILHQVNEEMGIQQSFNTVLDVAKSAYNAKSKNAVLKKIQELKSKDYSLIQPITNGQRLKGEDIKLSKMMIIDIYNALKNPDIREDYYMTYGDVVRGEDKEDGTPTYDREAQKAIGRDRLNKLVAELSTADKAFADAMQEQVQSYREKINEVFVKEYNRDMPMVENYWPSTAVYEADVDIDSQYMAEARHPSFSKQRTAHRSPRPMDAFDKFSKHVKQAEWYSNMALPIARLNRIFKNKSIQNLISDTRGEKFNKLIETSLRDYGLQPSTRDLTDLERIGGNILGNWVASKIGMTPSVPFKQLTSVINYSENMPIHKWSAGFIKGLATPKATFDYMWENVPYLRDRFRNGYSEALEYAMNAQAHVPKSKNLQQSIKNIATIGTRSGDIAAIVFGGKPYLDYLTKEKGMTMEEAVDKFLLDTLRSQQAPFSSTLSHYQNSRNPFAKALFTFANTPSQYMRKMFEANQAYRHGDINESQLAKIYSIYAVANQFLYVGAGALIAAMMRGSDPDRDLKENTIVQMITSLVAGIPLVRDIANFTSKKLMGVRVYDDALPVIGELEKIVENLIKVAFNEDEENKAAKDAAILTFELMGIPAGNSVKLYNRIVNKDEVFTKTRTREADDAIREIIKKDGAAAESANTLKKAYSQAKSKATRLESDGRVAEAERLRDIVNQSKVSINMTDMSKNDFDIEIDIFEGLTSDID